MKVLCDTSAFVALACAKDEHHAQANATMDRIARERHPIYTSTAVLYETLNWLAVKRGPRQAAKFGREARRSQALTVLGLSADDEAGALVVLEKYSQIPLSFVDASSIHLFHKMRFDRIFSFDRHFVEANLPRI